MQKVSINLPFPGFYESLLSSELDHIAEMTAEHEAERQGEECIAPELRLSEDEIAEALFDVTDWQAAHQHIAREWVAGFETYAKDELDIDLRLDFEEMVSPREYNFTTDRIFAQVSLAAMRKLFRRSKADNHVDLSLLIRKRFTSYDGFLSHYSNDLGTWLSKPLADWDHNELGTLLLAMLPADDGEDGCTWAVFNILQDAGDFDAAYDRAVDWTKFAAKVDELRQEKLDELRVDDPDYIAPTPRCPLTLDLFRD